MVIELLIESSPPPLCTRNHTNPFHGAQNGSTVQRNRRRKLRANLRDEHRGSAGRFLPSINAHYCIYASSHVISSVINLHANKKSSGSTKESKSVKTQIYHLIHAHTSFCPPPICHRAAVSMKRKTKGKHVVSREDKHTRLSGLHMHEFEGKQGSRFAESVRKRLHFLNSTVATARVMVELD